MCPVRKPKISLGAGHQTSGLLPSWFFYKVKRLVHTLEVYIPNMAAAFLFSDVNAVESYLKFALSSSNCKLRLVKA